MLQLAEKEHCQGCVPLEMTQNMREVGSFYDTQHIRISHSVWGLSAIFNNAQRVVPAHTHARRHTFYYTNPSKKKFVKIIFKFSPYRKENTTLHRYEDQPVNGCLRK
jgi:hypothetical protein